MNYYFNGGMYLKNKVKNEYEFAAVKPTNGLPYITKSINGIPCAEHHSSIYQLSEDFTAATLIKDNGTVPSPKEVKLSEHLKSELMQAIRKFESEKVKEA